MRDRPKPGATLESAAEQEMRDHEVLRANRELAAYFKGRRTEREARAALKIIKAFVRDRERQDARRRRPLPGADEGKTPKKVTNQDGARDRGEKHRRKLRTPQHKVSKRATATIKPQANAQPPQAVESDERTPGS